MTYPFCYSNTLLVKSTPRATPRSFKEIFRSPNHTPRGSSRSTEGEKISLKFLLFVPKSVACGKSAELFDEKFPFLDSKIQSENYGVGIRKNLPKFVNHDEFEFKVDQDDGFSCGLDILIETLLWTD